MGICRSYDILPALKSGVSLQRRMTYQRSIHLRNELRSVLECCYKKNENKKTGIKNIFFIIIFQNSPLIHYIAKKDYFDTTSKIAAELGLKY